MATFTSLGIGSGVDLNSMVTQLVALERAPLTQLTTAAKRLQTQVSSFGQIQSLFGALQDASNKLSSNTLWSRGVVNSADPSTIAASGGTGAAAGSYAVTVEQLAGNQTLASATSFPSATSLVGAGTLRIQLGTWASGQSAFEPGAAAAVDVDLSNSDTLQTLRDKINGAGAGVTATLVTDAEDHPVASVAGAAPGTALTIEFGDGKAGVVVAGDRKRGSRKAASTAPGQTRLF